MIAFLLNAVHPLLRRVLAAVRQGFGFAPGPGTRLALAAAALCARSEGPMTPSQRLRASTLARLALVQMAGLRGTALRDAMARFERSLRRRRQPLSPERAATTLKRLGRRLAPLPASAVAGSTALLEDVARIDGRVSAVETALIGAMRDLAAHANGRAPDGSRRVPVT